MGSVTVASPRTTQKVRIGQHVQERRWSIIFALPAALYFAVFWLVPLIVSVYLSFTSYDLTSSPAWVGTENYRRLANDPQFWSSLRVTLLFSIGFVIPTIVIALLVAVP